MLARDVIIIPGNTEQTRHKHYRRNFMIERFKMRKGIDFLTKVTSKRQITLPAAVCRRVNINEGDHLRVKIQDGGIFLEPVAVIDRSQAWFWTPEWQAAEREASDDIEAGRVFHFDSVDEAIAALEAQDNDVE